MSDYPEYEHKEGLRKAFAEAATATEALYLWSMNAKDPAGNFPHSKLSERVRKAFVTLSDTIDASEKNSAWLAEAANYVQKTQLKADMLPPYMKFKDPK